MTDSTQPPNSEQRALGSVTVPGEWTVRTAFVTTLRMLAVGLLFFLLYRFYMVVFLLFVAIALQIAVDPVVGWLNRHKIRKDLGIFIVFALLLALLAGLGWLAAPLLTEQGRKLFSEMPAYYQSARTYLAESRISLLREAVDLLPEQPSLSFFTAILGGETSEAADEGRSWVGLSGRTLFSIFAVFALIYYWTLEGDLILRKLVLHAPADRREEVRSLIAAIQVKIGRYFRGQVLLCVIVGVVSTVAFLLLGVPNALFLGLLMGIFEAVPMLGPLLGAIPAVLMTLAASPDKVLWVIVALTAIQVAENNLLVPRIMGSAVGVNAVVTLLAIAAFGVLFGITGAILAIPMAAIFQIFVNHLLFNKPLSDDASASALQANDVGRGRFSVLRMEAQSLIQDVRTQGRPEEVTAERDAVSEQAKDEIADGIESLAVDLDSMLAQREIAR